MYIYRYVCVCVCVCVLRISWFEFFFCFVDSSMYRVFINRINICDTNMHNFTYSPKLFLHCNSHGDKALCACDQTNLW